MRSIWMSEGDGWRVPLPHVFTTEQKLHDLIAAAPHLLPLTNNPRLTVIAYEAPLDENFADLLAVDDQGGLYVIEVKLRKNTESRRGVAAQILSYAASLRGLTLERFDQEVLQRSDWRRTLTSVVAEVTNPETGSSISEATFRKRLADTLRDGSFRLVFVFDGVPHDELRRIAGLLGNDSTPWSVDVVAVTGNDAADRVILFPELVTHLDASMTTDFLSPEAEEFHTDTLGIGDDDAIATFRTAFKNRPEKTVSFLEKMMCWAMWMERRKYARLHTQSNPTYPTFNVLLPETDTSMVVLWPYGAAVIMGTVLSKAAPNSVSRMMAVPGAYENGKFVEIHTATPEFLAALTQAYREAATGIVGNPSAA